MAEHAGHSMAALEARRAVLFKQHSTAADADHVLAEALASAHAAAAEGINRLDAIAEEIESAVGRQAGSGADSPVSAREFQRFLIAKQREIIAVVSTAHELDNAKKTVLEGLRTQYGKPVE